MAVEEASVTFSVDSEQCSEDEEDDLQRKEELHQLLSEQLADDLLDDTMSTSVEEEFSLVSTPQSSPSPQLSRADVPSGDTQPHDNHMTYDYLEALKSPEDATEYRHGNGTEYSVQSTERDPVQVPEFDEAFSQKDSDVLSRSPVKLRPPLPAYSVNDTSDVFAGTSQAYANQSLSLPSNTVGGQVPDQLTSEMGVSRPQDGVSQSHDVYYSHSQSDVSTYSDYFPTMPSQQNTSEHAQTTVANGYSGEHNVITSGHSHEQILSLPTGLHSTEHAQYFAPTAYTNPTPSQDVALTASSHAAPSREEQLEILHHARGRQINLLSQQLSATAEDSEKHIRILRHEKLLIENERAELAARLEQLEALYRTMEESVASTQGQLAAEQVKSAALEAKKTELISRLQTAEATVNSLTKQVTELTSSDTLSRIRDNYSQALSAAAYEHKQELLSAQKETDELREKLTEKDDIISRLEQQVRDHFVHQRSPSSHTLHHGDRPQEMSVAQQLEYNCEGCDGVRVVELVGHVEDLTFQLTTTQEELQQVLERTHQAESELRENAERLGEIELERAQLMDHVASLQAQQEEFKVHAEAEKKAALEHCRSACLKLHEESTQRLRETVSTEKERFTRDSERQITLLKSDLATVQEEYVTVCVEKDKLEAELATLRADREGTQSRAHAGWATEKEAAVQEAVGVARAEWEDESRKKVETALKEQEVVWQKRLDKEREVPVCKQGNNSSSKEESVIRPPAGSQDGSVREAVRLARIEWLKEKEKSLTVQVESAVCAAQRLWKEQHLQELDKLKKQYEADSGVQRSSPSVAVKQREFEEAIVLKTKKECEQQYTAKLQEALALEKQRWSLENQKTWEQREQELIASAHKEWSTAQETVTATELEKSRQEWEEAHVQKTKAAVQETVLKAKRHYESVVKKLHSELVRNFESQKITMETEIRQLEGRLASLLQQQQQADQPTRPHPQQSSRGPGSCQCGDVHTCHSSEASDSGVVPSPRDEEVVGGESWKGLLQNTAGCVKKDILALLTAELEAVRKLHREEIARTRESTAQEIKQYYLQCLHQLVNSKSHDRSRDDQSRARDTLRHSSTKSGKLHATQAKSHDPSTHHSHSKATAHQTHLHKPTFISELRTDKRASPRKPVSSHPPKSQASSADSQRRNSPSSHVTRVTDTKSKVPGKGTVVKNLMSQTKSGKQPAGRIVGTKNSESAASGSQTGQGSKRNLFGTTSSAKVS